MSTKMDALVAKRDETLQKLSDAANAALKASTDEEKRSADAEVDRLTAEADGLDARIILAAKRTEEERDYDDALSRAAEMRGNGFGKVEYRKALPKGASLTWLPDAKRSATLDDFGDYMQGVLNGESRAQTEGTNSEGGYLVPTQYAAPILDLVVANMAVRQAGATLVPMDTKTVQVGRLDSDPTPAWRLESGAVAESAAVFGNVTLIAKSLAVHVKVTLEMGEDSRPDFGSVLGESLGRAFALEADRVALYGSGAAGQPTGLKGTSGVTITHFVGVNGGQFTQANGWYGPMIDTAARLKVKNYQPTGIFYAPRTEAQFAKAADSTYQPLAMPAYLKDAAPHYVTGQMPTNLTVGTSSDCSDFIVGDWRYLLIGLRTNFQIFPVTDALMISNGQRAFVGWMRMDVAVARTGAFEILDGIKA